MKKKGLIISILVIVLVLGLVGLNRLMRGNEKSNITNIDSAFIKETIEEVEPNTGEKMIVIKVKAPTPEAMTELKNNLLNDEVVKTYKYACIVQEEDYFIYRFRVDQFFYETGKTTSDFKYETNMFI